MRLIIECCLEKVIDIKKYVDVYGKVKRKSIWYTAVYYAVYYCMVWSVYCLCNEIIYNFKTLKFEVSKYFLFNTSQLNSSRITSTYYLFFVLILTYDDQFTVCLSKTVFNNSLLIVSFGWISALPKLAARWGFHHNMIREL